MIFQVFCTSSGFSKYCLINQHFLETKKINYGKVLYSYYQKDKTRKEIEFPQEDAKKINSVKEIERFINSEELNDCVSVH